MAKGIERMRFGPDSYAKFAVLAIHITLLLGRFATATGQDQPSTVQHVERGNHFAQQGRIDLAVDEYEKALHAGAGSAAFLNRLGQMYLDLGEAGKARNSFRNSLKDKPGEIPVLLKIIDTYLVEGRLDSAISHAEAVRVIAGAVPGGTGVTSGLHAHLAMLFLHADMPGRALTHIDTALSLDPKNPDVYRYRAVYHTQNDSIDAALSDLARVIQLLPNDMEAHNNIAFLHANSGRLQQAWKYYDLTKEIARDPRLYHAINLRIAAIHAIMDGKMRARYILVNTEAEAIALVARLGSGEDFATLAQEFSNAPNAQDGGDLGFFGPGELLEPVEQAVLQLEVGQVSPVIPVGMGMVIIQRLN